MDALLPFFCVRVGADVRCDVCGGSIRIPPAPRATATGARDMTKYGTTRVSTRSFYTHHTQRLSTAAVRLDAKNIRRGINRITAASRGTRARRKPSCDREGRGA